MNGAPSQVDTFDPKPELAKHHGQPYAGKVKAVGSNGRPVGYLMRSPFEFREHGRSGLPISSLFPHTAKFADDLCVLRSLYTDTAAHASGCLQMNTGSIFIGRPSLGAWLSYGLGTMNAALPSFVVMTDPRGGPIGSASNWSAGFMPAAYQGTLFRSIGSPLLDLATPEGTSDRTQRRSLDLLKSLNEEHLALRPNESELVARIESYELAFRMQTEASDVFDLSREPKSIHDLYGSVTHARQLLITRRLIERGVRFVQVFPSAYGVWDSHQKLKDNHTRLCATVDLPVAGLIRDLRQRGLLERTLVVFCTEFGRTPGLEQRSGGVDGRDHHPNGFTIWMAGAGVKKGFVHGATDELGYHALGDGHYVTDLHATTLHLLGLDNRRLHFPGRKRLEIDDGNVIHEILA